MNEAYIEQLRICPHRPSGPLPRVSTRLLQLVRDYGPLEPVVVRRVGEGYEILSNVETWMAAQQVQLERVPIHVLEHISEEEAAEIVAASFEGYASDPIDEAEYFHSQVSMSITSRSKHKSVTKLSYRTGHSRTYISHSLRLLRLPVEIQAMVRAGRLSPGHARALVSIKLRSSQLALAKRITGGELTVRQTEALARDLRDGAPLAPRCSKPRSEVDPNVIRLQEKIGAQLGCRVLLDTQESRLSIDYHNLDILDGVLQRLGISNG